MTVEQGQFDTNDEAALLAMVEGLVSVEQIRAIRERLGEGTPEQRALLCKLDGMKRDRAAIASMTAPAVPLGMVEAAMRRAQREALAGLRLAGEQTVEIPVSRVIPKRTAWWTGTRRLVAAAALVGVVGGVGLLSAWPKSGPEDKLIAGSPTDAAPSVTNPPENPGTNVALGNGPGDEVPHGREGAPVSDGTTAAPMVPLALAPQAEPDRTERMLELAKAGRLVIRVAARSPRQSEQQLAALASRPQGSRVWDVSATPPSELVMSLAALKPRSEESPDVRPAEILPAYAGTSDRKFPMIVRLPQPLAIAVPPKAEDLIGLVRVAPTREGIESVRRALAETLGEVTVSELPEPLAGTTASVTVRTIDSALWWAGPPTRWATWASVPVIIER